MTLGFIVGIVATVLFAIIAFKKIYNDFRTP